MSKKRNTLSGQLSCLNLSSLLPLGEDGVQRKIGGKKGDFFGLCSLHPSQHDWWIIWVIFPWFVRSSPNHPSSTNFSARWLSADLRCSWSLATSSGWEWGSGTCRAAWVPCNRGKILASLSWYELKIYDMTKRIHIMFRVPALPLCLS